MRPACVSSERHYHYDITLCTYSETRGDAGSKLRINYAGSWVGERTRRFRETEKKKRQRAREREKGYISKVRTGGNKEG